MTDGGRRLGTDRHYITKVQYADGRNLAARQSIYSYREAPFDLQEWVIDAAGLSGDERVLDVGCGNGAYLAALERRGHAGPVIGADLSPGMAMDARAAASSAMVAVADIQRIPLTDRSVDAALAMHMLYHVPDIARAAAELRRVVRPDGVVLVVTNASDHLNEMASLFADAVETVTGTRREPFGRSFAAFNRDNATPLLQSSFGEVVVHDHTGRLRITDAAPVGAYAASVGILVAGDVAGAADAIVEEVLARAATIIEREGALSVTVHTACFICR